MDQATKSKKQDKGNNKIIPKADEETLQSTDPQEYMKGPFSSVVHAVSEEVKKNDKVSKEEATHKRDEKL